LVVRPDVERVARAVEGRARALDVPTWPTPDGLRYVTVRASERGECLVELIAGSLEGAWLGPMAEALSQVAGVVGVSASPNASQGNAMRACAPTVLWGRASLLDDVGPLRLEMRADTFSQLHLGVAAQMYARAAQWAWEDAPPQDAPSVVWDLYCGLGGLGLRVALERPGAQVWGAESVEGSLDLARRNAAAAKVEARYEVLDLRTRAPSSWPAPELVLVNPPRRGLDAPILAALARSPARAVLYMSCGPESFARDVASLARAGWRLDQAEAHDMLPQTAHVELLGVLRR
jgi:tRNA/tmRNA/rRNA uracil-C5-methylase (TrmA/RlmC/RlmD family)